MTVEIRPARLGEAALMLNFVRELADYEKLADEVEADEGAIDDALFAKAPRNTTDGEVFDLNGAAGRRNLGLTEASIWKISVEKRRASSTRVPIAAGGGDEREDYRSERGRCVA